MPAPIESQGGDASSSLIDQILHRPDDQRLREHKYRFAQAVVFGLPVLALQAFGVHLGGAEAGRWVVLFQVVLAGWVLWTGAGGMLFDAVLLLDRRITPDFAAACIAAALYFTGLIAGWRAVLGEGAPSPLLPLSVLWIAAWSGVQWWRYARRSRMVRRALP